MRVAVKSHALPVYKKNRIASLLYSRGEEGMVRNPYKWISKREEEKKKEKKKAGEKPQDSSQV